MTYRFEYRYFYKYVLNKEAGFGIVIDDEFETIEILSLSAMNKVLNNRYIYISSSSKEEVKRIIEQNMDIFRINSYLYLDGINKEHEQLFYFELYNNNRKIEGCNINCYNNDNEDVKLLIKVFNEISNILKKENIFLDINNIKNDK